MAHYGRSREEEAEIVDRDERRAEKSQVCPAPSAARTIVRFPSLVLHVCRCRRQRQTIAVDSAFPRRRGRHGTRMRKTVGYVSGSVS